MIVGASHTCVPIAWYRSMDTPDSRDKVVRSPRLAAMGVAILSGLILSFLETKITKTIKAPVQRISKLNCNQLK